MIFFNILKEGGRVNSNSEFKWTTQRFFFINANAFNANLTEKRKKNQNLALTRDDRDCFQ